MSVAITVQSDYNFTHALYLTRGARVFQRGQRNNYACTYKFTRLQNTRDYYTRAVLTLVPYIFSLISV